MSKVKTGFFYWMQIFLIPVFLFSCLIPRDKKLWVCGSTFGKRFADNPKYFYLYMNQYHRNEIRMIWITKDRKILEFLKNSEYCLEAYYLYSIKGIWFTLRASVYLYDNYTKDICFSLSGRAKKINLWHGIPLKKIQRDNKFDKVRHPENIGEYFKWQLRRMTDETSHHYILSPAECLNSIFSSAFGTKHVITCGYPRNDKITKKDMWIVCTEKEKKESEKLDKMKKSGKRILLYMPTFRDSEQKFLDIMDFRRFQKFLEKQNFLFGIKLHHKSKMKERFQKTIEKGNLSNFLFLDPKSDPYFFLDKADILITDYSSIYFDYLLLDRPIIFFDYDRENYLAESREFYFEYEKYTPGIKVETQEQLEQALIEKREKEQKMRRELALLFHKELSGYNGEKLYQKIKEILK